MAVVDFWLRAICGAIFSTIKLKGNERIFNVSDKELKLYEKLGVDLIFSGHVHGGLIRFGKLCLLSPRRKFFPKYSYGKYKLNTTTLITSSGIGNATIPIRMFNQPEIVEVILKK